MISSLFTSIIQNPGWVMELFDLIPVGISITLDRTCREIRYNEKAAEFLRIQPQEVLSYNAANELSLKMYHEGKELSPEEMPVRRAMWLGETTKDLELDFIWDDGVHKTALYNTNPIIDEYGSIIGAIATFKDITEPKEAEEAVRANRNLLFNIIDETSDLVYVKDLGNRTLLANRALAEIKGKPFGEIIGYDINECFGPEAGQMILENDLKVITTGKSEIFEETIHTADGDRIFLANKFPYRKKSGEITGVIGILRDITELKKTEEKILFKNAMVEGINRILQESLTCENGQELGKTCLEVAQDITGSQYGFIGIIDHDGFLNNMVISDPGWSSCRMPEGTGHGKQPKDLKIHVPYGKALLDERPFFTNTPALHPDIAGIPEGHPPLKAFLGAPLTYQGKTIGMIGLANREGGYREGDAQTLEAIAYSIVQVIMRLRAEVALKESEERYRNLAKRLREVDLRQSEERFYKAFHSSPAMMYIQNSDGRFIEINDKFIEVLGFSRDEVIGRSVTYDMFGNPGSPPELKQSLAEQKSIKNLEVKYCAKSGEQRTGLLSTEFIELNGEQCILVSLNDITELRRFEKEMSRLDRLSLVGEMAGGIAHEIRNPMTSVRGYLQFLAEKKELKEYIDRFRLMISELDRANSIITEYLTLARDRAYDAKPENLNVLIKDLIYLIETDAIKEDKYINLQLEEAPDLLLEKNDIKRMILNLIRNGLEAMSPGGYLTVRTFTEGEEVILAVSDQGKGIPPEHLDKMGIPFFTTKDYGTGLGLAMCYKIAARHNAEIKIETGPDGTTFFVKFGVPGARVSCDTVVNS